MNSKGLSLKQQILLAAAELSGPDSDATFTQEDLLVCAWKKDPSSWGLRGYENEYPDLGKIQREVDTSGSGQRGMVLEGLLNRIESRLYRITPKGLAMASELQPSDQVVQDKVSRKLETELRRILEHREFKEWLKDPSRPKLFRQAGHFWGIAPGTPAKTVRERVYFVDQTLKAALEFVDRRNASGVAGQRGKVLFDREDIKRCLEFQAVLKQRFAKDLRLLDPEIHVGEMQ